MRKTVHKNSSRGFTLVELLVSIAIFAVLMVAFVAIVNPIAQLEKLWNSQRKQDLEQIRNALDTYYNDHGCYPTADEGIPFGSEWKDGDTLLMKEVPIDPHPIRTRTYEYPYQYYTDADSTCPQWNILLSSLDGTISNNENTCLQMVKMKLCKGYRFNISTKYYYCIFSGDVDCQAISDQRGISASQVTTTTSTTTTTTPTTTLPSQQCYCSGARFRPSAGLCNRVPAGSGTHCSALDTINCSEPCIPD